MHTNIFSNVRKAKGKALKQLFSAPFEGQDNKLVSNETDSSDAEITEKASNDNPLCQLSIPQYVAEKLWNEGQELASLDSNICASPGCTDGNAWLVKSNISTHQRPFFVECKKAGQLSCEKSCIMFNSSGVCAHTVAVATRKECLDALVNWLRKRGNVNITKMAHAGLTP